MWICLPLSGARDVDIGGVRVLTAYALPTSGHIQLTPYSNWHDNKQVHKILHVKSILMLKYI